MLAAEKWNALALAIATRLFNFLMLSFCSAFTEWIKTNEFCQNQSVLKPSVERLVHKNPGGYPDS